MSEAEGDFASYCSRKSRYGLLGAHQAATASATGWPNPFYGTKCADLCPRGHLPEASAVFFLFYCLKGAVSAAKEQTHRWFDIRIKRISIVRSGGVCNTVSPRGSSFRSSECKFC